MKRLFALALVVAATAAVWVMLQKKVNAPAGADVSNVTSAPKRSSDERRNDSPLKLPLANPHIVVKKRERRLTLFDGDKQLRAYRIGLGFTPVGDKTHQGD